MKNRLVEAFEREIDPHDRFASCMEWFFTICHVIHHKYGRWSIPDHWEYTPSPLDTHIDFDEYTLISDYGMDRSTLTELLEAGEFLIEFRRMLAENGEDY